MDYKAHKWPGLKNPVYLPDTIPVEVKLITNSRFRSNSKTSGHTKSTFHDTGNPGTNADAEYRWAAGGRIGAGVGGYNGIFDDRKVIITQPFDEVVWAAGTAVGNATSYHFEQAWGTGVNFQRSLEVGAAVHGGILAAKGWGISALVQHHHWYGKHCPGQIRNKGLWPTVTALVEAARIKAVEAAGDVRPAPSGPKYVEPVHIKALDFSDLPPHIVNHDGSDFIYVNDLLEAIRDTPRLAQAGGDDLRGGPVKKGERFVGEWLFRANDGQWYYITPTWHTRIRANDVKRIADVGEAEAA